MGYSEPAIVIGAEDGDEIVLTNYRGNEGEGTELTIITPEGTSAFVNLSDDDIDNLIDALEQAKDGGISA